MADERRIENPPEPIRKHKKTRRERQREEAAMKSRMTPDDLAASHKKFMAVMIVLFAIVLTLMFLFNSQVDFMPTGGM